jgi:hypothetical protein
MSKPPAKRLTPQDKDAGLLSYQAYKHGGAVPVPFLGTTWLSRGAPYWGRRVGAVVLFILLLGFIGALMTAFTVGIYGGGAISARVVLTVVYVLCTIPGLFIGRRLVARAPLGARQGRRILAPSGVLAMVLAPISTGAVLYVLLSMFGRDFIGERRAREASTLAKP